MLDRLRAAYQHNLFESVIPFWMRHSIDPEHGGFFTCLDRDGALYDTRKYSWLNGRQVWMLSTLYNTAGARPEWLDAARSGAEFLRRNVFDEHGRCYFSLAQDGRPAFFQRKPYAGFFVMLGFLEYAKASGDPWYHQRALQLEKDVRRWIADSTLLGRPALPGGIAYSQLADIYVSCAMALELDDLDALRQCLRDLRTHVDPATGLLHESASIDPSQRRASPDGRLICPGSIFEISWYLFRALDRLPDPDPDAELILLRALDAAFDFGWDQTYGGFHYFKDIDGRPTLQLESDMKLWWVHAEALYALLVAYLRTGDPHWLNRLQLVFDWTWSHFPDPQHGEWFGYLHRDGSLALTLKGNNYKGCFHIPRMLLFSLHELKTKSPTNR